MRSIRGLQSPVIVAKRIDLLRDYSAVGVMELAGLSDQELAAIDPLAMNLVVAKGIPALADLDIRYYQNLVDSWAADFTERCLPRWEPFFYESPHDFKNDIRYFRLGMVCQYLDLELGIEYKHDQREIESILYTDPSDLFLNGVLDTREGTCGSMAALQYAIAWRLGWPVSIARAGSHFILRFDDGETIYNIEATQSGRGGFKSDSDEYIIDQRKLPPIAVECGSDLRALRPREVLGAFVGSRARHLRDVGLAERDEAKLLASEPDWLLARHLFPASREIYKNQMAISVMRGDTLFEPLEAGHPTTFAACLNEVRSYCTGPRDHTSHRRLVIEQAAPSKAYSPETIDELFSTF